jgi:hypothetical protein
MCRLETKIEDDVPVPDAGELGDDNEEHNEDDTETEREVQAYGRGSEDTFAEREVQAHGESASSTVTVE